MRLIDIDALMTDLDQTIRVSAREENSAEMRGIRKVLDRIKAAPTISPDEVRGVGKWEHQEPAPTNWTFCSVCGRHRSKKYKWYYCPNCGARMKGAEDGTTYAE